MSIAQRRRGGAVKCQLCSREAVRKDYCFYHELAYKSLMRQFEAWKDAYGELDWANFLERVVKLRETGEWAKQIAEYLNKKEAV